GVFVPLLIPFTFILTAAGALGGDNSGALASSACLFFCGTIVAFIAYLYINVRLQLVVPAVMVESLGPVQALRRSWRLVQGYWWRTFGLVILLAILSSVITAGPAYLVQGISAIFLKFDPVTQAAISGGITVLTTMFYV